MSSISSQVPNRSDLSDQLRAQKTEKEEAQEAHEREMKHLREGYEQEKVAMEDRFESSIQAEKINHYDNLRNLKRQIDQEEKRLNDSGHEVISQKNSQLQNEEVNTQKTGQAKIDDLKRKYAAAEAYENNSIHAAQDEIKTKHHKNAEMIIKDSEEKIGALQEQKFKEVETQKTSHGEALQQIHDHYTGLREQNLNQFKNELINDQHHTSDALNDQRLQNAEWLSRYTSRQNDPFYRMTRFDSQFQDTGDTYTLRVMVPEHERGKLRVQVTGQDLQLNGIRSNNEKAEVEPGRWISTSSYQNYSERFPLTTPVDGRSLTTRDDGDWVEFTVKKYGPNHRFGDIPVHAKATDADMYSQLDFPSSLPKPSLLEVKPKGTLG